MSFAPENFAVWAEIRVIDLDRAIVFYNKVFNIELKKCATSCGHKVLHEEDENDG